MTWEERRKEADARGWLSAASMVTEQDVVSDLLPRRAPGSGGRVYLEGHQLLVSARLLSAPCLALVVQNRKSGKNKVWGWWASLAFNSAPPKRGGQ